jgi:hypothetical protein
MRISIPKGEFDIGHIPLDSIISYYGKEFSNCGSLHASHCTTPAEERAKYITSPPGTGANHLSHSPEVILTDLPLLQNFSN